MKAWFVGITKHNQELRAAANLREYGYRARLAKTHIRHQEGRKVEARTVLRFRGYIFIEMDLAAGENGPIKSIWGMDDSCGYALLGGAKPSPLRPGYIEMLECLADQELAEALATTKQGPRTDLKPGDHVLILGDKANPAYGRRGVYADSQHGTAIVWEGSAKWKVPEIDLKRLDQQGKRAA